MNMTKIEIAKVKALSQCKLGMYARSRYVFLQQMVWAVEHNPKQNLSWRQRFYLDSIVWTYRSQLAVLPDLGFQLPSEKPEEYAYDPACRNPHPQEVLL